MKISVETKYSAGQLVEYDKKPAVISSVEVRAFINATEVRYNLTFCGHGSEITKARNGIKASEIEPIVTNIGTNWVEDAEKASS